MTVAELLRNKLRTHFCSLKPHCCQGKPGSPLSETQEFRKNNNTFEATPLILWIKWCLGISVIRELGAPMQPICHGPILAGWVSHSSPQGVHFLSVSWVSGLNGFPRLLSLKNPLVHLPWEVCETVAWGGWRHRLHESISQASCLLISVSSLQIVYYPPCPDLFYIGNLRCITVTEHVQGHATSKWQRWESNSEHTYRCKFYRQINRKQPQSHSENNNKRTITLDCILVLKIELWHELSWNDYFLPCAKYK